MNRSLEESDGRMKAGTSGSDATGGRGLRHPETADFIAHLRLRNLARGTIYRYRRALSRLFRHVELGDRAPSTITQGQLREYVASLYERGLAAGTIESQVVAVKQLFRFLTAEGYTSADPAGALPYPKTGSRLPRALKVAQVRALFAAMSDSTPTERRDRVFFELLYTCGLRIGEAVRLRLEDVNWEDGRLRVVGKGDKERRVYLRPEVERHLREHVDETEPEAYLFPGRNGPISTNGMRARFKIYVDKAELPRSTTPHTLRHSAAVHYLMGGAPISFVQDLLGHESLETTGIYTQLVDDLAREITLTTENALYEGRESESTVRETSVGYTSRGGDWDDVVEAVLPWLADPSDD